MQFQECQRARRTIWHPSRGARPWDAAFRRSFGITGEQPEFKRLGNHGVGDGVEPVCPFSAPDTKLFMAEYIVFSAVCAAVLKLPLVNDPLVATAQAL